MYCGKCGTMIPEGGNFCPKCRRPVRRRPEEKKEIAGIGQKRNIIREEHWDEERSKDGNARREVEEKRKIQEKFERDKELEKTVKMEKQEDDSEKLTIKIKPSRNPEAEAEFNKNFKKLGDL